MKIITINCLKGGVGKTAISKTLAKFLSMYGKTLLIDSDESGNATRGFVNEYQEENKLSNIFRNKPVSPLTITPNLDIICGSSELKKVNAELYHRANKEMIFKRWLIQNRLEEIYDYIVIDTHNDSGNITTNMLVASDFVLGVTEPSGDSFKGLLELKSYIEQLSQDFIDFQTGESLVKAELLFLGNKLEGNTNSSRNFQDTISDMPEFIGSIPKREIFNTATLQQKTIFDLMDEDTYQTTSFKKFFTEVIGVFDEIKLMSEEILGD